MDGVYAGSGELCPHDCGAGLDQDRLQHAQEIIQWTGSAMNLGGWTDVKSEQKYKQAMAST